MPLKKGPGSMKYNMTELMKAPQSASRQKAIATIAKRRNISREEAQGIQAKAIAIAQARRRK